METKNAINALAALAQETRLSIFRALVRAGAEGLPAGAIADAVGTAASTLSFHLKELTNAGLVYKGLALFGGGAILAGMVLGAITAFVIDKQFLWAAGYALGGAALSFIGLIHGTKVGWNVGGEVALGYAFAGVLLLGFWFWKRGEAPAPDIVTLPEQRAVEPASAAGA